MMGGAWCLCCAGGVRVALVTCSNNSLSANECAMLEAICMLLSISEQLIRNQMDK
jgi:hypothetical protein